MRQIYRIPSSLDEISHMVDKGLVREELMSRLINGARATSGHINEPKFSDTK